MDGKYEESRDPTAELDDTKYETGEEPDASRTAAGSTPHSEEEGETKEEVEGEKVVNGKMDGVVNEEENNHDQVRKGSLFVDDKAVLRCLQPHREQPKDWADLTMLQKLDSIHTVIEWHFHNPQRLRQVMKSDDETASWVRNRADSLYTT